MNLKQFRELTKDLPDDAELVFEARSNPCGNIHHVLSIEATAYGLFGVSVPCLKFYSEYPGYIKEDNEDNGLYIDDKFGTWAHG